MIEHSSLFVFPWPMSLGNRVECGLEALGEECGHLLRTRKENNTDCELCFESLCKITRATTILFDLQIIYAQKKCGNKVSGS